MTTPSAEVDLGALLVKVHRHAWRADAPPLDLELAEVVALMPNLIQSGSVGLVWPRLRHRAADYGVAGIALEKAYQSQIEHNRKVEREIGRVVTRLREAGIEPVLVKGWSVSRLYPEGIVRPAGDIDLVVQKGDYERAHDLIFGRGGSWLGVSVDLKHEDIWEENPQTDYWATVREIQTNDVPVQTLSPEDELRMLCFHFLKHGGQRPIWLCDIGAALENRLPTFNWHHCLGEKPVEKGWIISALGLAKQFVGAATHAKAIADAERSIPLWIVKAVERQWQSPSIVIAPEAMSAWIAKPSSLMSILKERWPDPLRATIQCHAPIDSASRFQWQLKYYAARIGSHARHRMLGQVVSSTRRARVWRRASA